MKSMVRAMTAMLLIAVTAAVPSLALVHGDITMKDNSDFSKCLCWDTAAQTWCADNGKTSFWRDSCNSYLQQTLWWAVPVTIVTLFLFLFPCIFACARLCCNCCGGRQPSYGCCCPTTTHEVLEDTEVPFSEPFLQSVPTRRYTRRTARLARLACIVIVSLVIYFSVSATVGNAQVDSDIKTLISNAQYVASTTRDNFQLLTSEFSALSAAAPSIVPPAAASVIWAANQVIIDRYNSVSSAISDVRTGETAGYGRATLMYIAILTPPVLLLVSWFAAGTVINVMGCVASFMGGFLAIGFLLHMFATQLTQATCANADVVVNAALGGLAWYGVCNQPAVVSTLTTSLTAYNLQICSTLVDLCATSFTCPASQLASGQQCPPPISQMWGYANAYNSIIFNSHGSFPNCPDCTIAQCAADGSLCPTDVTTKAVLAVQLNQASVHALNVASGLQQTQDCNSARALLTSQLQSPLCLSAQDDLNTLSPSLLGELICLVVAVGVLIRAAKRLLMCCREWRAADRNAQFGEDSPVYGTPIEHTGPSYGTVNAAPAESLKYPAYQPQSKGV